MRIKAVERPGRSLGSRDVGKRWVTFDNYRHKPPQRDYMTITFTRASEVTDIAAAEMVAVRLRIPIDQIVIVSIEPPRD